MHLPSVKTKVPRTGQLRHMGHIRAIALPAVTVKTVLHFMSKRSSLLLFGISSVCLCVDKMNFSAFPEEFSVMRCLFLKKKICLFSQRSFFSMLCTGMSCHKASLLGLFRVQPWTVLLNLPLDNQEHLCHILRKLFTEKCAERETRTTEEKGVRTTWTQAVSTLLECSVLTQTNSEVSPMWPLIWDDSPAETGFKQHTKAKLWPNSVQTHSHKHNTSGNILKM